MTDIWQPNTVYAPGATVRPVSSSVTQTVVAAPTNAGFDEHTDLTGWTADAGYSYTAVAYAGSGSCKLAAGAGAGKNIVNTNKVPVVVGQRIAASCMVMQGTSDAGDAGGGVAVFWYDADDAFISHSPGTQITSSGAGWWQVSGVNAVAPAGAATAAIGAACFNNGSGDMQVDSFAWDYARTAPSDPPVFTAVQSVPGHSGATEPDWSDAAPGDMIVDNEVTWEAGTLDRITWQCSPLMKSGDTEPDFPAIPGATVHDGTIDWVCITPQITDTNCPQTKYVAIAASKVYAVDDDICRYCATSNPLDWTSANDAGFLPIGLNNYGTNPFKAVGIYRSNLVFFNANGLQMWQVDEDPANAALLDTLPIGSEEHKALSPVSNDLFFLTPLGVRTMGIAAGTVNLAAGDVGMPIDPLVRDAIAQAKDGGITPLATYYPSQGQYLLAFPGLEIDAFFLTSRPYPIDVSESMQSSAGVRDAWNTATTTEAVEFSADFISAELAEKLHSISQDPEGLDLVADFVSAELRSVLHTYSHEPEAVDLSAALVSADLHTALVSTDMEPEAVEMAVGFVSAEMT